MGEERTTRILAEFIAATNLRDIPKEAGEAGKRAILDFLGVALAGLQDPLSAIILDLLEEMGGKNQATVWGKGIRTSSPLAAMANGAFGHALDYDDWNRTMRGHPTVPVLPAVLALAEERRASGRTCAQLKVRVTLPLP